MAKVWLTVLLSVVLAGDLLPSATASPLRPGFQARREAVSFFKTNLKHTFSLSPPSAPASAFTCDTCKAFFEFVRYLFDRGFVMDEIAKLSIDFCEDLQIEDHAVCSGIIPLFKVSEYRILY